MMVRAIAIITLMMTLLLVGAAPAMFGAPHYAQVLRREHAANTAAWGHERAWKVLADALEKPISLPAMKLPALQQPPRANAPAPGKGAAAIDDVFGKMLGGAAKSGAAAAGQPGQVLGADYFHSLEVMLTLAGYRAAMTLRALPLLFVFGIAAINDGMADRKVRARSFVLHDPELFAASWVTALLLACLSMIVLLLPDALPPWLMPLLPLGMIVLLNRAIANYRV